LYAKWFLALLRCSCWNDGDIGDGKTPAVCLGPMRSALGSEWQLRRAGMMSGADDDATADGDNEKFLAAPPELDFDFRHEVDGTDIRKNNGG